MSKKKKRELERKAAKIVTALRDSGAVPDNAAVEVRIAGRKKVSEKKQAKPGRISREK